jgi:hypothetical protein
MKKSLYTIAWASLIALNQANAAIDTGINKVNTGIQWSGDTADVVIQRWVVNIMTYLSIAAVLYGLWWGFLILTAAWDENKVKSWKTVIINALIWIVVIFIVGSVVRWLLWILV